ncbi:hypothetical protein DOTSEDRAFT_72338 [Dothistroma septosporum NZE10]|uniref:Uncharacterized protein n=1 Tax=Dothistroma septosporum (strain NZE10 / CBS 128990) TaxID=675120 RepID=M2Y3H8_DOTSN|nr:hypothetical protein DOTSEDRAFT_72338 [Dothistroma septosporum NZE10]
MRSWRSAGDLQSQGKAWSCRVHNESRCGRSLTACQAEGGHFTRASVANMCGTVEAAWQGDDGPETVRRASVCTDAYYGSHQTCTDFEWSRTESGSSPEQTFSCLLP